MPRPPHVGAWSRQGLPRRPLVGTLPPHPGPSALSSLRQGPALQHLPSPWPGPRACLSPSGPAPSAWSHRPSAWKPLAGPPARPISSQPAPACPSRGDPPDTPGWSWDRGWSCTLAPHAARLLGRVCRSREGVQVGVDRAGFPEACPGGRPVGQCASQLQTGASANLVVTMLDPPSFHLT